MKRRVFIKLGLIFLATTQGFAKTVVSSLESVRSNFKAIYGNSQLKAKFYHFLENVFNLYPQDQLHDLISSATEKYSADKEIYTAAQGSLSSISPYFSVFKYQLPALLKQKNEMARQTLTLLGEGSEYNGYLEIGSSGRYLDYLEEKVVINGKRYYSDGKEPGFGITEMIDRGQIGIGAEYIPMANYNTDYSKYVPSESLDLVTVYIGFHHCPFGLRNAYISSIRNTLRIGGKLVLRDHDCDSEEQKALVGLAHDVFNMGTNEAWQYNANEVRNFYSLDFIIAFVEKLGFKFEKQTLFQEGDPTKNALMLFTKV